MIVFRIRHPGQAKVTDLEVAGGVEQEVAGLQVPVEDIGGVDVLEASEYLIEEVADMIIAQSLGLQQFVQIRLHQTLHDVDVSEALHVERSEDVPDIDDILVLEPVEDLDFPQSSLAVSLVLEGADLLDGDLALSLDVHGGHHHAVGSLPDILEVEIPVAYRPGLAAYELRGGTSGL